MADPHRVAEARRLLAQLGVTMAELQTAGQPHPLATSLEDPEIRT